MKRSSVIGVGAVIALALVVWLWRSLDASRERSLGDDDGVAPSSAASVHATEHSANSEREYAGDVDSSQLISRDQRAPAAAAPHVTDKILVRGTIRDAEDPANSILGATVTLVRDAQRRVARTDFTGSYAIDGLASGSWVATVEANGFSPWSSELTLESSRADNELDVALTKPGVLTILIQTPDGGDLFKALHDDLPDARITILATHEPPDDALLANPDASCRISGEIEDANWLHRTYATNSVRLFQFNDAPPLYLSACFGDHVLQTQRVPENATKVVFGISPEELTRARHDVTLRVLDAQTGAPLAQAKVTLARTSRNSSYREAEIDRDGVATIRAPWPGRSTLSISVPEYEQFSQSIVVSADGPTSLGTFALSRALSATVELVDEHDRPFELGYDELRVDRLDGGKPSGLVTRRRSPDSATQRIRLVELGAHKYVVRLRNARLVARPTLLDMTEDGEHELTIRCVKPVHTRLRVELATADEVDIVDENQLPVIESALSDVGFMDLASPPGKYTATLIKAGQVVRTTSFEVATHDSEIQLVR
jgi:hypothetical protein